MGEMVDSAKGVFLKKDSKKDDKKHDHKDSKKIDSKKEDKHHHHSHKKSSSEKDIKHDTKKDNKTNDKKEVKAVSVADKNVTAPVEPAAAVPAPASIAQVEVESNSIIPASLSSFFSNWSKPGPHPAYI
jgi:hypothetical protein